MVTCKVCNSKNVEELVFKQDVFRCKDCFLLFRTQKVDLAKYFEVDYWYKEDELLKLYQRSIFEWFKDYIVQGNTIEFGGADGDFIALLRKVIDKKFTVVFNEIIPMLRAEYTNQNIKQAIYAFEDYTPKIKFSNIFFINTIEHLNDPITSLKKTRRMLANNGRVFILTDDGDSVNAHNEMFYHWEHTFLFSHESLWVACQKTGFKILKYFKSPQKMIYVILEKVTEH